MRSPLQALVDRPLQLRREMVAVGLAAGGILLPFLAVWLLGRLPPEAPLEGRLAWVLALSALGPVAGWIVQNESESRIRALPALLLPVAVVHLAMPGSALFATADVFLVLGAAAVVLGRGLFRIGTRRHLSAPRRRLGAALLLVLAGPGPLFMLGWGLVAAIVIPAGVRLVTQTPVLFEGERAVTITTADGLALSASYAEGEPGAPGVVLVHGFGDTRRRMEGWARDLHALGAHTLRFDHRGFGASEGVVCTLADREPGDVVAAVRWLEGETGSVSLFGTSMGGGAILAALPGLPEIASFVLLAPASDFEPIVGGHLPPEPIESLARAMIWGVPQALGYASPLGLHPGSALDHTTVPGTIVHSREDRTIPPALTEALAEAHPELQVVWLERGHHDDTPRIARETEAVRAAILARLGLLGGADRTGEP